ncbi:hypothetical protein HDU82_000172 [Entophlyctis luteolus]|nr:hypothetical protein HDU82_000172 [Entophlyctis luteolus]
MCPAMSSGTATGSGLLPIKRLPKAPRDSKGFFQSTSSVEPKEDKATLEKQRDKREEREPAAKDAAARDVPEIKKDPAQKEVDHQNTADSRMEKSQRRFGRYIPSNTAGDGVLQQLQPAVISQPSRRRRIMEVRARRVLASTVPEVLFDKAASLKSAHSHFSYRQDGLDREITERFSLVLQSNVLTHSLFLDKYCLTPGTSWELGFVNGLLHSGVVLILLSPNALTSLSANMLLEWQISLHLHSLGLIKIIILKTTDSAESQGSNWISPYFNVERYPKSKLPHRLSKFVNGDSIRETVRKLFQLHISDEHAVSVSALNLVIKAFARKWIHQGAKPSATILKDRYGCLGHFLNELTKPTEPRADIGIETMLIQDVVVRPELLGEGSYGLVFEGAWRGKSVAVKKIRGIFGSKAYELVRKESNVWYQLRHAHIVELYGVCMVNDAPALVMERMKSTVLEEINRSPTPSYAQKLRWLIQAADAIAYLHTREAPIAHSDLKPDNLMVDFYGDARLMDFGLSQVQEASSKSVTLSQAARYAAPESYVSKYKPTPAYDVFAFGMTAFHVMSGLRPFHEDRTHAVSKLIQDNFRPDKPNNPAQMIPEPLWNLIGECWHQNPGARPTITDVFRRLRHEKEFDDTRLRASAQLP